MPYYIRAFVESDQRVSIDEFNAILESKGIAGNVSLDGGDEEEWEQLLVTDDEDNEVAIIEWFVAEPDSTAEDELHGFSEEVAECEPESAAKWLLEYFGKVKSEYLFQILDASESNGWKVITALHMDIRKRFGGILQADGEGFTNRHGHHILRQFSNRMSGPWDMAVLNDSGEWEYFEMELGNPDHRAAFKAGKVPAGIVASRVVPFR